MTTDHSTHSHRPSFLQLKDQLTRASDKPLSTLRGWAKTEAVSNTRGSHYYIPCTSTCDGDFTDILIPYATCVRKGGVTTRARSYTHPFTTRNQRIKTLEKLGQAIKQAPRYESSDQGLIFEIKIFDRRRSWKYRAYSGDYPL